MDLNASEYYEDQISNITNSETIMNEKLIRNLWIGTEFLFLFYYVIILFLVVRKHYHKLEPVHILTIAPFVDQIFIALNILLFDVMTLIGYENNFKDVFKTLFGMLAFSFHLDALSGDLNGFIFVQFEVYYHEYITNNVAIMSLVINKVIAAIGAVVVFFTVV